MSRSLPIVALAVASCAPVPPGPPLRAGPAALRIVTWNVHDLFDEEDRLEPPGEEDTVLTPAQVESKLARVGAVLARLEADVVVLEEVEGLALLERLASGPLAARGYRAFLVDAFDPRGVDVGALARVPVTTYHSHADERAPDGSHLWSRDLVEIHLAGLRRPLVVLGTHLVSRLDPAADPRRRLQAQRMREVFDALRAGSGAPLVIGLGDLNDLPVSVALAPLFADGELVDLGATLEGAAGWTWSGGGREERIDYAFLARDDLAAITRFEVASGPDVAAASDHRPVVLDVWP
jgi:endonuclease/exonuclease/phosphatase family metal-dependent hydrolase